MTVVVPGQAEPATLPVSDSPFTALKLENGWVETPGHSVSDSATVLPPSHRWQWTMPP